MKATPAAIPATEINNAEVARRLGVSRSAVHRFRSGDRVPRMATQIAIARVYHWPVSEQAVAHSQGEWAREFEAALCRPRSV